MLTRARHDIAVPTLPVPRHSMEVDTRPVYAEVTGRGVEVVKPIRDEPWGMREFGIRTADGHGMMFGTRM